MLIYVEIDVCVVPNWSYVMICDRKFNLKTTCVKSNICDSFSIYISDVNLYFFLVCFGFVFFVFCRSFTAGLDWLAECREKFRKTYLYLFIFFFNLQCEIIETKNAHI